MKEIMASRRGFLKGLGVSAAAALIIKPTQLIATEPALITPTRQLPPNVLHVFRQKWQAIGGVLNMQNKIEINSIDFTSVTDTYRGIALGCRQASFDMELLVSDESMLDFLGQSEQFALSMSGTVFEFKAYPNSYSTSMPYDTQSSTGLELEVLGPIQMSEGDVT